MEDPVAVHEVPISIPDNGHEPQHPAANLSQRASGIGAFTAKGACAAQFYADTTDFSGVPDPSMGGAIPATTNGTTDGDQYVALAQRQSLEPLFAEYNVDVSLCPPLPEPVPSPSCTGRVELCPEQAVTLYRRLMSWLSKVGLLSRGCVPALPVDRLGVCSMMCCFDRVMQCRACQPPDCRRDQMRPPCVLSVPVHS